MAYLPGPVKSHRGEPPTFEVPGGPYAYGAFPKQGGSAVKISVELSEEEAERLRASAQRLGVRPEDLARAGVAALLRQPEEDFRRAAEYILRKNEDLYRRLA